MKRVMMAVAIFVVAFAVISIGLSIFIGSQVFSASTQLITNNETQGVPVALFEKYDFDYDSFCSAYEIEKLEITSSHDQHVIPADYIYAAESAGSKNRQTVLLVHGLGDNRYSNYPLAGFFLKQGYNVLTYDQRSSNENKAKYTTFGYWEKHDLIDWVNYVEKEAPGQEIGVWGASFGGATAGLALGHENMDEKIDFLILDCPVSSMGWMIEQEMSNMETGIPTSYLAWCGNIINRLKLGFSYQDADVANAMRNVSSPVLIINSKLDELTPPFMGQDIYDAITGNDKEIWTVDDSAHCEAWLDHNREYCDRIESFLSKISGPIRTMGS